MDSLRVCVVGCGDIVEKSHIAHWQDNPRACIHATVDSDARRARDVARRVGAQVWYTDYHEAMADTSIEAVDIALPHRLHRDATEVACAHGKPVLCEKPMAMTVADAQAMNQAAAEAGVPLAIRHTMRYTPVYQQMRSLVQAGEIGEPLYGAIQCGGLIPCHRLASLPYWNWFKERTEGGGAIAGVGIHGVDVLLFILEGTVRSAWAAGGRKMLRAGFSEPVDVEDTAAIAVSLKGGAVLQVTATWALRGSRPPAEVHGTAGALIAADDHLRHLAADGTERRLPTPPVRRTITDDFVAHLLDGAPLPAPGSEVIESVKVLEACYGAMEPLG